jgi:hypothetical protein
MDANPDVDLPWVQKPQGPTKRFWYILISSIVLVIVVVLAVSGYFWYRGHVKAPVAVKPFLLAQASYENITVSSLSNGALVTEKTPSVLGSISDYTTQGSAQGLIATLNGFSQVLTFGTTTRSYEADTKPKASLALSPDGTYVAYAEQVRTTASSTAFDTSIYDWDIILVNTMQGGTQDLGQGFAPTFVTSGGHSYLLYTAPRGPTIYDFASRSSATVDYINFAQIDYSARMTSDGKYLALRDPATATFDFYSVTSLAPLTISAR